MDLWECYKHSVFLCHQELGDDINFAIISAQNPLGTLCLQPQNLRLDCEFENELHQHGWPYRRVIGASPDLSFKESSWAVLCDKRRALELAKRYQQNAIYWVEQGELYLVPALFGNCEEHLGAFRPRQIRLDD